MPDVSVGVLALLAISGLVILFIFAMVMLGIFTVVDYLTERERLADKRRA